MAFTSTQKYKTVFGDKRVVFGTYTSSGGGTGGDINTGMAQCDFFIPVPAGSGVATNATVVNETLTFPIIAGTAGGSASVTIVSDANQTGFWMAIGN